MSAWIVVIEVEGSEMPTYVGPFLNLDNARRFAEDRHGYMVLLDPPEDYAS